jgi:hypothetical protein
MKLDEPYKRATKEDCLWLAECNFRDGDEYRMWQWLLEWATWDEDLSCTITKQYAGFDSFMDKVLESNNG